MIGETLSHFKIVDKLGEGGMGVVYRADDMDLDRPVAIKVLPPEAQRDEESLGRFLREAKTASKLQHPNITTIYEFGVKEDLRYLVMEFVEGKTLKEMLKQGPLPTRQLLEITIQLVDALRPGRRKSHNSPRHQVGEHHGDGAGPGEDPGLRPGQDGREGGRAGP